MTDITLSARAARQVASGNPWIFANEIEQPLVRALPPGGRIVARAPSGAFLGQGYANPRSLIAARVLSWDAQEDIDSPGFFAARLRRALDLRRALWPERDAYRLAYGEGDGLPGLILDRYGPVVAAQVTTLGMEARLPAVQEALQAVLPGVSGVLRNDTSARELEGLAQGRGAWFGDVPERVDIEENGVRFRIRPLGGQKTGHFFDQAENRRFAAPLCRGRAVLDAYANTGAFGMYALRAGAASVTFVEQSADCCDQIAQNAALNDGAGRAEILHGDARALLTGLLDSGRRFGAVVLDPPAFAKARKAAGAALKGYRNVNALGMRLLEPGGFLFTSSCSHHILEERFLEEVQAAADHVGRRLRVLRRGEQGPDHPVLPVLPQTRYLKSYALQVL